MSQSENNRRKLKNGAHYFHEKDIIRPVGAGLLVIGLVLLWIRLGYVSYMISVVLIPAGLILFLLGATRHISDSDLNAHLDALMEGYDQPITEDPHFDRLVLKQPADFEVTSFRFDDQAHACKKMKNGTPVSDIATRTHFFYTHEGLWLAVRTVSLTADDPKDGAVDSTPAILHESVTRCAFDEIASIDIVDHADEIKPTNGKQSITAKWCELILTLRDEEPLRIPVPDDMDCRTLCEDVRRHMG